MLPVDMLDVLSKMDEGARYCNNEKDMPVTRSFCSLSGFFRCRDRSMVGDDSPWFVNESPWLGPLGFPAQRRP